MLILFWVFYALECTLMLVYFYYTSIMLIIK